MDDLINEIAEIAVQCEQATNSFDKEPVLTQIKRLQKAIDSIKLSWSGSWLGYHSLLYLDGLRSPRQGEYFDSEWGNVSSFLNQTRGEWREYSYTEIENEILRKAQLEDTVALEEAANQAENAFDYGKHQLLPIFDALLATDEHKPIKALREQLTNLNSNVSRENFVLSQRPTNMMSRDSLAVNQYRQGFQAPPHLAFEGWLLHMYSYGKRVSELAKIARHAENYLKQKNRMKETNKPKAVSAKKKLSDVINIFGGNVPMGDKFEMSGNFQGAIINIKSRLDNVNQSIGSLPSSNQETKQQVTDLVNQLKEALQTVPAENVEDANKVTKRVEALIEEVKEPKPDEEEIKSRSDSLKRAAENLASAAPSILNIATQIINHVPKLLGQN